MNLVYLHNLLNHFPTVGMTVGIGLFLVALGMKSADLERVSLGAFVVIALVTLPAYLSGNGAQEIIETRTDVSGARIEAHQDAALLAFLVMGVTGTVAWLGLWQYGQRSRPSGWNLPAVFLLAVLTLGLMARAATLGGDIRHPEIRSAPEVVPAAEIPDAAPAWPRSASIASSFVFDNPWVWPVSEVFHFVGLCLVFGVTLLVNLRVLGVIRNVSFAAVHRLLPWAIVGYGVNAVTGMLFFIANHAQYSQNSAFQWKMILLLLAGLSVLYFTIFDNGSRLGVKDRAPFGARIIALGSTVLWVGVIFLGRWLPYLGSE